MALGASQIVRLIEAAKSVYGEFKLGQFSAGSCAAAVLSERGDVFTGICIDLACGIGFCAEHAAVAEMLKARQSRVLAAVAVSGDVIVPPCGRCRELLAQINADNLGAEIVLKPDRTVPLRDLLPEHWLTSAWA
jgi:cytidine deaminase